MRAYVIADVFTDVPLEGNAVAVFTDAEGLPAEVMQRVARELNLSETVFVLRAADPAEADARIRIFTPALELPFAGHPVLGTAFVLGERLGLDAVRLKTGAGVVPVSLTRSDGRVVFGEMSQPVPTWTAFDRAAEVLASVGVERSELPVEVYDNGPRHTYVCLPDEASVSALAPDIAALGRLGPVGVSCFAANGAHVKTRMFGPGLGVAEDPATGSAAGPLAVHLARHGAISFGDRVEIRQGAEIGRPSILYARAEGTADRLDAVTVGGAAVVVAAGEFRLD
ncbi:MAG: PhzF family phenazine biosynthesis protein [Solirubrobacteraceae bacterium]